MADTSIRVLVVDDEPGMRRLVAAILESEGICVIGVAADGAEAVAFANLVHPDVVLIDYQMPILDGITVIRRLMQGSNPPQVVIYTAGDVAAIAVAARAAGAARILSKLDLVRNLAPAVRYAYGQRT